jgi:hypothetical protein
MAVALRYASDFTNLEVRAAVSVVQSGQEADK